MTKRAVLKVEMSEQLKVQTKLLAAARGLSMTDLIAEVVEKEVQRYPEVNKLQNEIQVQKGEE